ncbi:hypothetical protein [Colwellia piezophila]|nr:hypothetical protein [Colwellia piezophila]
MPIAQDFPIEQLSLIHFDYAQQDPKLKIIAILAIKAKKIKKSTDFIK